MAERSYALKSNAYGELKESFDNKRDAVKKLTAGGKQSVWMLGDEVPEEIIIAAGLVPVRLWGTYNPMPNADRYLEISFGSLWRGLFESVLSNENTGLMKYLVLSNSSDIIQKLYYYLIQIKKIEPERILPEIDYVDYWLVDKDFRSQERNLEETKRFAKTVEAWAGKKIDSQALSAAINLCNDFKTALRSFSALRYGPESRLTGSEAVTAIGGSFYQDKRRAIELLNELTREAEDWPKQEGIRCLFTGSMQETTEVYGLMESAGLNVITEDKIIGDRYADLDTDIFIPPLRAVSGRYHNRFPSSERSFIKDRAESLPRRAAEVGAEAAVIFMNRNDESYIWDLPRQKAEFEKLGIRILTIENQYYPLSDKKKLLKTFGEFAESVRKENGNG